MSGSSFPVFFFSFWKLYGFFSVKHRVLLFNIPFGHSQPLSILKSFFSLTTFVSYFFPSVYGQIADEYQFLVFLSPISHNSSLSVPLPLPTPCLLSHSKGILQFGHLLNHKCFVHSNPVCSLVLLLGFFFPLYLFFLVRRGYLFNFPELSLSLRGYLFLLCGYNIFSSTAKDANQIF